jgi:hypothetical protein
MDTFDEKNQSCKISRYCTFKNISGAVPPSDEHPLHFTVHMNVERLNIKRLNVERLNVERLNVK